MKNKKYKISSIRIFNYSILNKNIKFKLINFIKNNLKKLKINNNNIKVYRFLKNKCNNKNILNCYRYLDKTFLIKIKLI